MSQGVRRRSYAVVVILLAVLDLGCAARWAYRQGQEEARRGNWDMAVARLTRALQKDPENIGYKIALENARIQASRFHYDLARKHLLAQDLDKAVDELEIASKYDPANKAAADELAITRQRILTRQEAQSKAADFDAMRMRAAARSAVPVLSPRSPAPIALTWRDQSLQKLFETLGKLAGVNVLFDEGFRDKNVSINLTGITFEEALDQLAFVNRLFYKVLDQNTIIIVPETQAKRRSYDPVLLQTFYLQNAEVKDVEAVIKTAVGVNARVVSNPTLGAINVLGTADQLAIVSRILDLNDKPRGEVVVEVQILEVDRERAKNYGINLSNYGVGLTFAPFAAPTGNSLDVRAHLLSSLNLADFVVNIPNSVFTQFVQNDTNVKILASPRLRAAEGKKTSLKIGTEVPIPVTTFTAAQTGGSTFAPATSFQYRNVGVNLELTPKVSPSGDIVLELAAEFSLPGPDTALAGQTLPSFLTRNVNGILRLRDGETALIGGLLQETENETFRGILGVQSIPIVNRVLGSTGKRKAQTEILFSITPRLVRAPKISEGDLIALSIGTQEIVRVPAARDPLFAGPDETEAPIEGQRSPAPPPGPSIGRPGGTVSPSMTAPEDVRTPAALPTPVPMPIATPLPAQRPEVVPTPPPGPIVPEPTPPPAGTPGIDVLALSPVPPAAPGATGLRPPTASATGAARIGTSQGLAGRATATFSPAVTSVGRGETATVGIVIMGAQDLTGVGLTVAYDPTLLEATDVNAGSLLTLDGQPVGAERGLEQGRVRARFSRAAGASGSGVVASITFRGLKAGTGTLTAENVSVTAGGAVTVVAVSPGRLVVEP